jgi:hypothetical protein
MLSVSTLSVAVSFTKSFMLTFAKLSVMMSVNILSHLLSVLVLSVIMLSGIMLNVVEPPLRFNTKENNKTRTSC